MVVDLCTEPESPVVSSNGDWGIRAAESEPPNGEGCHPPTLRLCMGPETSLGMTGCASWCACSRRCRPPPDWNARRHTPSSALPVPVEFWPVDPHGWPAEGGAVTLTGGFHLHDRVLCPLLRFLADRLARQSRHGILVVETAQRLANRRPRAGFARPADSFDLPYQRARCPYVAAAVILPINTAAKQTEPASTRAAYKTLAQALRPVDVATNGGDRRHDSALLCPSGDRG
ncbi:hypothetical protein PHYPSEUDO_012099 [Phytophthora pseudosyringae]|uniref:Uncharacterized protein n=1 Tax=Phytophthora pseudosyringae TaxID=221518 RepID=A0A8T1W7C0_9STRA|nr:hypothetical protein PHYPSEUDO_012099 [Phytophthora pseudosyringae]